MSEYGLVERFYRATHRALVTMLSSDPVTHMEALCDELIDSGCSVEIFDRFLEKNKSRILAIFDKMLDREPLDNSREAKLHVLVDSIENMSRIFSHISKFQLSKFKGSSSELSVAPSECENCFYKLLQYKISTTLKKIHPEQRTPLIESLAKSLIKPADFFKGNDALVAECLSLKMANGQANRNPLNPNILFLSTHEERITSIPPFLYVFERNIKGADVGQLRAAGYEAFVDKIIQDGQLTNITFRVAYENFLNAWGNRNPHHQPK